MAETTGERTEDATDKRMKEVREKGKLQRSQDVGAWVCVGAAAVCLPAVFTSGFAAARDQQSMVAVIAAHPTANAANLAMQNAAASILPTIGVLLVTVTVSVLVASIAQGGLHFKKLAPKFEQFDPVKGVKNMFGGQAMWNGAKSLLKTAAIGGVLLSLFSGLMDRLIGKPLLPVDVLFLESAGAISAVFQWAVVVGLVLAVVDVMVIATKNKKQTMMTLQEVKDENKSTEGDPLIKSRRRALQMSASRNRMIADTAKADVVIVNPTHIALAMKYDETVGVPQLLAKGSDEVAARMREIAAENNIPLVESRDLAWGLWEDCEVGEFVPNDLFNPIAQVFAFVRNLKSSAYRDGRILQLPKKR
jgi:flagellar biosynthetic protein FlhB